MHRAFTNLTVPQMIQAHPQVFDNYICRVLLGVAAYDAPIGALGEPELLLAQQRLALVSRLHVATAMVDEKWQEIRPLLDLSKRRVLRSGGAPE